MRVSASSLTFNGFNTDLQARRRAIASAREQQAALDEFIQRAQAEAAQAEQAEVDFAADLKAAEAVAIQDITHLSEFQQQSLQQALALFVLNQKTYQQGLSKVLKPMMPIFADQVRQETDKTRLSPSLVLGLVMDKTTKARQKFDQDCMTHSDTLRFDLSVLSLSLGDLLAQFDSADYPDVKQILGDLCQYNLLIPVVDDQAKLRYCLSDSMWALEKLVSLAWITQENQSVEALSIALPTERMTAPRVSIAQGLELAKSTPQNVFSLAGLLSRDKRQQPGMSVVANAAATIIELEMTLGLLRQRQEQLERLLDDTQAKQDQLETDLRDLKNELKNRKRQQIALEELAQYPERVPRNAGILEGLPERLQKKAEDIENLEAAILEAERQLPEKKAPLAAKTQQDRLALQQTQVAIGQVEAALQKANQFKAEVAQ